MKQKTERPLLRPAGAVVSALNHGAANPLDASQLTKLESSLPQGTSFLRYGAL